MNFLSGGGEMGARMRSFDWSKTPLGPIGGWPHYLRTALSICLNSRFAMPIWWGPERVQLYNDAFIPILGGKHPEALGRPGYEVWPEIWDVIGTQLDSVFATGEATWSTDLLLLLERSGYVEETYFTYSYSPIRDEAGRVQGAFTATSETTPKVISARRLGTLRDLGARAAEGKTAEEACALAAEILAANPYDVPFALIYLLGPEQTARLAGAAGLAPGEEASPRIVNLKNEEERVCWPLADVARSRQARTLTDIIERCGPLPGGPWPDPPHTALVLPLSASGHEQLAGILVAGVSPRRALDDDYRSFFDLVAGHISTAVANARAYEEERRRAEALAELDRAKTLFFSNVSHEFRTPLTLMLGPLEDVLAGTDGSLPPEVRQRVDVAHRNSLRLLKLVNTLLDFSRIEAGRVQASYEPTDLSKLTADLASVFRSAVERAGLRLRINCDELPEPIYVDREMWEKVVLNLVSNAFKFTFEGEIEVRLRAAGGAAELTVRDTGIGIAAEEIPHLFERFHRVEGARGRTYEGTGIGLALVQELVKLHGGSVRVESVVGEGSSFIITLPFGQSHLPPERIRAARTLASTALSAGAYVEEALRWLPDEAAGRSADGTALADIFELPRESPVGRAEGKRLRILLADDNADMRDYVRRLLSERYEVETATDGEAALGAARARTPDLVLTDIMMPRLDGFGLLKALREDPATSIVPVILLSARAGEESRVEGIEAGADDYLVKPFAARELLARVGTHLDLARARREEEERTAADLRAMRRLYEVGNLCARAGHDFEQCLAEVVGAAVAITGADKGNIQLLDAESGALLIAAHRGFAEPFLTFFARVGYEEAASCGAALRSGGRVVVEDVTRSEIFAGQPSLGVLLEADVRAVQSVPLVSSSGEVLGMISTHFRQPHRPAERELRLMDLLARQTADYLERRRAEEALRESEHRFRTLFESIDEGFCVIEVIFDERQRPVDYRFLEINPAFEKQTGIKDAKGRLMREIAPEHEQHWFDIYGRIALTGETLRFENPAAALGRYYDVCAFRVGPAEQRRVGIVFNDITERRRAEVELRRAAAIVESSDDAIISKDLEGVILSWNPGAERLYGYTAGETTGQPVTMLIPEDRPDEEPHILERIRRGERIDHYETLRRRKDGTIIDVSLTVSPVRDASGRIIGASKIARDITARKRVERELREQSEVIKQAYDAIFLRDPSNRITLWNKGAERLYGYTQEEARGRNPHELLQTVTPVPLEEIYASLRREGYWEGELRHTRKDGAQLVVETRWATVRDERGETTSILEIVRDVTERKRAEEELREQAEIIETVNHLGQTLAGELDLHRLVQAVTDAATEISGARFGSFFYNVLDERGESYMLYTLSGVPRAAFAHFPMPRNTDLFGPTFRGEGTVLIADVKRDPRYGKNSPYYGMPEGHLPVVSYLAVPVVSRSGEVLGGLFFGHPKEGVFTERAARIVEGLAAQAAVAMDNARLYEATQRARAEAEQSAAEKERLLSSEQKARAVAEEASRLKDEFLATVSHELRTPLTAILGWAHMLRTGQFAGGDAAKALETIERNARSQSQLIDDLLDVSRIITGKLRIDVRPVDPNSFIESAIEAVRPAAEAKGVRVQRIMDTGTVSVTGDPVRLQQVVWNLLSNSIKFTPRGGRVQVRMERVNSHVEITVSDTGAGIAPEFLPHVFDRFRQADGSTTRRHGGMGLGLAIVRHLVELHGGTVKAESPGEGQGATFTVLLPVAPVYQMAVEGERVHPAARDTMPSFDCAERLDGLKVLVVDDEPDTRELLKAGLGQCGAEVTAAASAAEALAAISGGAPDLLISDIGMPDEDGYDLVRRVRELPPESGGRMPAIALTAYARTEDRLQALRAGYQMHVPKPVEMAELVAVAASLVQRGK